MQEIEAEREREIERDGQLGKVTYDKPDILANVSIKAETLQFTATELLILSNLGVIVIYGRRNLLLYYYSTTESFSINTLS